MLRFLFDSDHLTHYEYGHPLLLQRFIALKPDLVGVPVVVAEEALRGRLAMIARHQGGSGLIQAYTRLLELLQLLGSMPIVPFDAAAETEFQRLRKLRLRVGTKDLRIASIAIGNNLPLLTCNRSDFGLIPGLTIDDWTV